MRKGTPLASRVAQGVSGPSSSCVWNPRKSGPGNRGRSACGTTHVARLEFPRAPEDLSHHEDVTNLNGNRDPHEVRHGRRKNGV